MRWPRWPKSEPLSPSPSTSERRPPSTCSCPSRAWVLCAVCGLDQQTEIVEYGTVNDRAGDGWTRIPGTWTCRSREARAAQMTTTCEGCGRTFTTDSRNPETHCTVCTVQALRDSVERMKTARRAAALADAQTTDQPTPTTAPDGCAVCGDSPLLHGTKTCGNHTCEVITSRDWAKTSWASALARSRSSSRVVSRSSSLMVSTARWAAATSTKS